MLPSVHSIEFYVKVYVKVNSWQDTGSQQNIKNSRIIGTARRRCKTMSQKQPPKTTQVVNPIPRVSAGIRLIVDNDLQLFDHDTPESNLTIAVYSDFYPIVYRRNNVRRTSVTKNNGRNRSLSDGQEYAGLDVDIMKMFCDKYQLKPRFVNIKNFDDVLEFTERWRFGIDVAIGGISRATWRNPGTVEWSIPYFRVQRTVLYRLADPIKQFPEDVTGKIRGTMGSVGFMDAGEKLYRVQKQHLLDVADVQDDKADLRDLLNGKIQGLMRGSFVATAIVKKHRTVLGMCKPWDASKASVGSEGEVFAFPCRRGSGLAGALSAFLTDLAGEVNSRNY